VPGIEWKVLYYDAEHGARTAVIRMAPNLLFPPHEHHGIEDLYLIEGTAWVGDIEMRAGDYCRAPEGTEHNDVRSGASGAMAVVVTR
jgi:anti-sigma factor ChrR (cupin superfamily)